MTLTDEGEYDIKMTYEVSKKVTAETHYDAYLKATEIIENALKQNGIEVLAVKNGAM